MTKRRSPALKREVARIHYNSVNFWYLNKNICKYENMIARKKAQIRMMDIKDRVLLKVLINQLSNIQSDLMDVLARNNKH